MAETPSRSERAPRRRHDDRPLSVRLRCEFARIRRRIRTVIGEARAHNFPESDRFFVQLFLLLLGLMPMFTSLFRETFRRVLHLRNHAGSTEAPQRRRSHAHAAVFVAAALALAAGLTFFSFYTFGTVVIYDGRELDIVDSEETVNSIVASVEDFTSAALGSEFSMDSSAIVCKSRLVHRSDLNDGSELKDELSDEVGLVTYGYALYIDNVFAGATEYPGALEELLDQLKEIYTSEDTLSIDFVEDVQIYEGYFANDQLTNLGDIAELLNSTKSGEVTYTVVKGDTWGKIAGANGMTNAELEKLNPGFDINKLQIGDELLISNAVPYLTVMVTERQNYVDDIQYDIEYTPTDTLYTGDYKVTAKGVYGTADVVADVVYINGEEQSREIISSVVLTEPVTEQRLEGTKQRPSWHPTGSFRWPTSSTRINSYFGKRNTGIKGASTNHKGIDIAASYGSKIVAADGGTVVYSGWWGSGGYTVIIDHGNGFKTYYEHNSKLLVSVGQHVYKGQQIAKAGSSGVSSGSHCHFGITKNGTYVNPLKYLP